jgi:CDP-4-dehydro-6-deoxyglucose reductase, E3
MVEDALFTVVARARRTHVIVELELRPAGVPIPYLPGQYVLLGDPGFTVPVRSYSIANAPRASGHLTVLVTRVAGGETSSWLHDRLRPGDGVLVSGPYGTFVAGGAERPVLGLAGGSGLAPIRALAEEAVLRRADGTSPRPPFTVLFSARTQADMMDADLFAHWSRRHPGLTFVRTLTREDGDPPQGRVPEVLGGLFPSLSGHEVYIAGGPGFVSACARAARVLGAPAVRVHTEEFFAEPQPWTAPASAAAVP